MDAGDVHVVQGEYHIVEGAGRGDIEERYPRRRRRFSATDDLIYDDLIVYFINFLSSYDSFNISRE